MYENVYTYNQKIIAEIFSDILPMFNFEGFLTYRAIEFGCELSIKNKKIIIKNKINSYSQLKRILCKKIYRLINENN